MTAQAPTDDSRTNPLAKAVSAARRSVKRVIGANRTLSQDLARLDSVLAESAGFTYVEEPTDPDTTAHQGEGES